MILIEVCRCEGYQTFDSMTNIVAQLADSSALMLNSNGYQSARCTPEESRCGMASHASSAVNTIIGESILAKPCTSR